MEELENLPSDTLIEMTPNFHRLFNSCGCDPACHNCWEDITAGKKFKLSTIKKLSNSVWGWGLENAIKVLKGIIKSFDWNGEVKLQSQEVMLCQKCTPEMYLSKTVKQLKKEIENRDEKGCFRINGKIVH